MSTVKDWLNTALDILKQTGNISNASQIVDIGKANAIALGIEQIFGVRPTVLQDATVSPPVYTLYFENTTQATNAIVATLDAWRGKINSDEPSTINYNFSDVLIPAIVREFFVPIAIGVIGIGGIGYYIGKAKK